MPDYREREGWEKRTGAAVYLLLQDWLEAGPDAWDRWDFIEDGIDLLAPTIERPYAKASRTLGEQFDVGIVLDRKTRARAHAKQFTKELATNVAADLRGLGKNPPQEAIDQIFSRERARRAGVTVTTEAISRGELDAAEQVEDHQSRKLQVIWRIDRSGNVCKVCRRLNGAGKRRWQRSFPLGPPAHPHCRCYLEFS